MRRRARAVIFGLGRDYLLHIFTPYSSTPPHLYTTACRALPGDRLTGAQQTAVGGDGTQKGVAALGPQ